MKKIFIPGIIFICSLLSFPQSNTPLPERKIIPDINYFDPGIHQYSDFPFIKTDSIVAVSVQGSKLKQLFEYNSNGKIAAYNTLSYTGQNWDNQLRDTLFYDTEGKLTEILDLGWYNNGWDSLTRISYFYEEGKLSSSVLQDYNQNAWRNISRSSYTYTNEGYLDTDTGERWVNEQWQYYMRVTYFYSDAGLKDTLLFELWDGTQWRNDKRTSFHYSSNNIDVDSMYVKTWNGSSWSNFLRRYVVNDNNHNQIEQLDQSWQANYFYNEIKRYYTYNESKYILSGNSLLWSSGNWVQGDGDLFIANPDGLTEAFISNYLYGYYSDVTAVEDNAGTDIREYNLSENYPNPFNPSTRIKYHLPVTGYVEIKIFNILGKEAAVLVNENKTPGEYEVEWNASEFPSGVYLCRMRSGGFSITRKLVMVK